MQSVKKRFEQDAYAFNAIYDHPFTRWFNQFLRKPIFERFDMTFNCLTDVRQQTVLDVGCGSGVYTTQFAIHGARRVKGVDFSTAMLQLAQDRAYKHGVSDRCEFELNDFVQMDESEKFDFVVAMGVFDYLADPVYFLKKMKRLTQKKIVISFPGHSLIREPLRKMRYILTGKGHVYFYSQTDIQRLVDDVGFKATKIIPMKTGSGFVTICTVGN